MSKFGGGFGGGNNQMQALMKQAQEMQKKAAQAQEEIAQTEIEGIASNGLVKVKITGEKRPISINIDPKIVDADDVEMLEDLILVALNDAVKKAEELSAKKMGPFGMGGF